MEQLDARNEVNAGLDQLDAMLQLIYGGGQETFESMDALSRDRYLWACHDRLRQVRAAWRVIVEGALRDKRVPMNCPQ